MSFENGSIGSIHYLANGSKEFPKERIEIFVDGKILQLNNFRILKGFGWPQFSSFRTLKQEKGQRECVAAFIKSLETGQPAIPTDELFEVSKLTVELAQNILHQV